MTRPEDPRLSVYFDRIEQAWQRGFGPEIEGFLPQHQDALSASRREILIELVMIDLERRRRATQYSRSAGIARDPRVDEELSFPVRPCLEDDVRAFSELGPLQELPLNLILHEYRVRLRWWPWPDQYEFVKRFPRESPVLRGALPRIDREFAAGSKDNAEVFEDRLAPPEVPDANVRISVGVHRSEQDSTDDRGRRHGFGVHDRATEARRFHGRVCSRKSVGSTPAHEELQTQVDRKLYYTVAGQPIMYCKRETRTIGARM